MCTDRDRVHSWGVRRWEEEVQHRHGAHHFSCAAVSGWTDHRTGFQHCKLHHQSTAQVRHNYLSIAHYCRQHRWHISYKSKQKHAMLLRFGRCRTAGSGLYCSLSAGINMHMVGAWWSPSRQHLPFLLPSSRRWPCEYEHFVSRLSRRGKTVIFSIHQPRYSIFKQFDHLTLMHKGEVVYAGAADHALGYFTDLGT